MVAQLELPDRVLALEAGQYGGLTEEMADAAFQAIAPHMSLNLRPSGILVFCQPDSDSHEPVYLISPTLVPPSSALKFIKRAVEKY